MAGEGFWQVAFGGVRQDGDCHPDAAHTQEGYTVTACEEHWRYKQGLNDDPIILNSFEETLDDTGANI